MYKSKKRKLNKKYKKKRTKSGGSTSKYIELIKSFDDKINQMIKGSNASYKKLEEINKTSSINENKKYAYAIREIAESIKTKDYKKTYWMINLIKILDKIHYSNSDNTEIEITTSGRRDINIYKKKVKSELDNSELDEDIKKIIKYVLGETSFNSINITNSSINGISGKKGKLNSNNTVTAKNRKCIEINKKP